MSDSIMTVDNQGTEVNTEQAPLLPTGWTGEDGSDFFNPDTWGAKAPDAEPEGNEGEDSGFGNLFNAFTIGKDKQETVTEDAEEAPTTGEAEKSDTIKFQTKIDHRDKEVELSLAELPALYQKAQVTERYQRNAEQSKKELEGWDALAKGLNYDSRADFMEALWDGFVKNYVAENPGVPEEMARDYLVQRYQISTPKKAPDPYVGASNERDFKSEVEQLYTAVPEARSTALPDEVVNDAVMNGKPLLQAYTEYTIRNAKAEAAKASKENKILKQNQAAAKRAPVSKVTGGGRTDTAPKDPFLAGLFSR